MSTPYTNEYFQLVEQQSDSSAAVVVPLLCGLLAPHSVVDVGCGTGTWLKHFPTHGVAEIAGIDGEWVDRERLSIPAPAFEQVDLSSPPRAAREFDLVVSLEVAEHLPPESAARFVEFLTELGPVVAFSAAIPAQGGSGHVNEQWPGYWSDLFARRGYRPYDLIRPRIWLDDRVAWWFRQNIVLYARPDHVARHAELAGAPQGEPLPLVHPELYRGHVPGVPPVARPAEPERSPLRRLEARLGLRKAATRLLRRGAARGGHAR